MSRCPPPPHFQALVLEHGRYDRVTPEAWAAYDAAMDAWKLKLRFGDKDDNYRKGGSDAKTQRGR